jgi:aminotransferase
MLCAPITAQVAAIEALRHGQCSMLKMVEEYNRRRCLMIDGFRTIDLDCFEPKGAFYIFPSVKQTGLTSLAFAEELLKAEKVALVPATPSAKAARASCAARTPLRPPTSPRP